MRKVFLHGELGNSLGKEWELEVDSVQEALWAIEANTNRLTQFLMKNNEKFTHYAFAIDDKDLDEHQLKSPIGDNNRAIHIMPQVAGGVEWLVYIVVMIVVSLIIQAIFRPPKPKDAIETNSYLFAGTQNVAAQGVPVPLGYGRLRVGSVVLSAAVRHLEYAPTVVGGPHGPYAIGKPIGINKHGRPYSEVSLEIDRILLFWRYFNKAGLKPEQALYSEEYDVWYYPDDLFWEAVGTSPVIDVDDPFPIPGWGEWPEGFEECWVAREVYGVNNPKWLLFRHWLLNYSPNWFCNWYKQNGKRAAKWLSKNSWLKPVIRRWMNGRIQSLEKNIK